MSPPCLSLSNPHATAGFGWRGEVAGWWFPPLQTAAAAGLFALMLCGLWARRRIRDPWYAMLPALALALMDAAIVLKG